MTRKGEVAGQHFAKMALRPFSNRIEAIGTIWKWDTGGRRAAQAPAAQAHRRTGLTVVAVPLID